MTLAPQWLNPLVQDLAVLQALAWEPASQLDGALIKQTPKPLRNRLLLTVEPAALGEQPINVCLGDHTTAE